MDSFCHISRYIYFDVYDTVVAASVCIYDLKEHSLVEEKRENVAQKNKNTIHTRTL